ncbi:MAG: ABC transporter substrate-binding protein [Chloroflexota bacterium]
MIRKCLLMLVLVLLLSACGGATAPSGSQGVASDEAEPVGSESEVAPEPEESLRTVTMAMPFIPSVQFAHFYLADQKGYYAEEGLSVEFDYNYETDVVQRVAQGTLEFGLASVDSVLLSRAQGLSVVTVATNSQQFPVVFFSKAEQNIVTPDDLRGKSVGIPGRFGASYIGLLALLYANDIEESELDIQEIGFSQVAAVTEDRVQVAAGYGNNEPLRLEQEGIDLNVIRVADSFPLASDGLVASEQLIADEPDVVRSFVQATLRAKQEVMDNPDEAFEISLEYIPELQAAPEEGKLSERAVLEETFVYWQNDSTATEGLGYIDVESWEATLTFLRDSELLQEEVDLSAAYTQEFLE